MDDYSTGRGNFDEFREKNILVDGKGLEIAG